jgi:NADH:ubiquinone oxidoreductase subunit 4 (subunit M)
MRPNKRLLIYSLLASLLLLVGLLAACSNQGGQTTGESQETGASQPTAETEAVAQATPEASEKGPAR